MNERTLSITEISNIINLCGLKADADEVWKSRKDRKTHPVGQFDRKKRWLPDTTEECSCCAEIRYPSAAYPYSLMTHCRTKEHVYRLFFRQNWSRRISRYKSVKEYISSL